MLKIDSMNIEQRNAYLYNQKQWYDSPNPGICDRYSVDVLVLLTQYYHACTEQWVFRCLAFLKTIPCVNVKWILNNVCAYIRLF